MVRYNNKSTGSTQPLRFQIFFFFEFCCGGGFFFFLYGIVRDLYTIFFLTKSAKKVRLLFLRGLEARRGFFEEMDFRLKYHHCTSPGGFTV